MTTYKPIRIAIVLNGEEFRCPPVILPFSLEDLPPVELVLYGDTPEVTRDFQVEPLAALHPEEFDLILDGHFLMDGVMDFSLEEPDHLISGPLAGFLRQLVCQLQELRQKQEINSSIIHGANDAIVTINEDHKIIGYNQGAEKMLGFSRGDALGTDLKILVPPPYKEEHRDYVRRYVATREARVIGKHVRLNAQRADGSEFPMSISFSVAEIRGNLYFTGIIRDITEYQEMEERALQSERLAAVGNTVTHIAHEIKNPLMIIGGFAQQLLKVKELDEKAHQKLVIISEEVKRLEDLMMQMRDFVRPPAVQKSPGRLEAVLEATLEFFQDTLKEQHIQLQRVHEGPLPEVNFDPQKIRQVFINLFKNAMEAMPRGGNLTVRTRVLGPLAEISVSDTGTGMPPEVAANIFQPYFTTKSGGTGLGLAICSFIIKEQHGGNIQVESTPGQGSTFTIQLPISEASPA